MSVFLVGFVALCVSIILNKKLYETIAVTIMLESIVLYLSDLVLGSLLFGFYTLICLTVICTIIIIIVSVKDIQRIKKYISTPECYAWIIFVVFFALVNVGRGLVDYDDFIVWGLQVKNMYIYNQIYPEASTSLGFYPPAMMCWNYLACKTWPFGYTESAIFWAYDVFIMACLLPLFRFVQKKEWSKSIFIIGMCLLLPISLTSTSYSTVYGRLCSDVILGAAVYYSCFVVQKLFETTSYYYYYNLLAALYFLTLSKRSGITWTVFPLLLFMYLRVKNKGNDNSKVWNLFLAIAILVPVLTYISWGGVATYAFIPLIILVIGLFWRILINCNDKMYKRYIYAICGVILLLLLVTPQIVNMISSFKDDTSTITTYFFNSLFSNKFGGYGTLVKIPIFSFCLVSVLVAINLSRLCGKRGINAYELRLDKLYVMIAAIILNLMMLYAAYLMGIGLDPYWDGLPAFERYISPYFMLILLWLLESFFVISKLDFKPLLIFGAIFLLEFANIGDFTDFVFDKAPQLSYPGLDNSGITLTSNDSIYYVNYTETKWNYAPFYYYVCPAISSTEGVIGYDKKEGTVQLKMDDFARYLIDEGYDYLYIKNLYDEFITNYSELFENPDDIHDNSFYRIDMIDGQVRLIKL